MTHANGHINTEDHYNVANWDDALSFWQWFYSDANPDQDVNKVTNQESAPPGVGDPDITGAANVEKKSYEERIDEQKPKPKSVEGAETKLQLGNRNVPSLAAALEIFEEYGGAGLYAYAMGHGDVPWVSDDQSRLEWQTWHGRFKNHRDEILVTLDEGGMTNRAWLLPDGNTYSVSTNPSIADIMAAYTAFADLMQSFTEEPNKHQLNWEARNEITIGERFGLDDNNKPPFGVRTTPVIKDKDKDKDSTGIVDEQEAGTLRVWYMKQEVYGVSKAHIDLDITDDEMSALATYFATTGNKFGKYNKTKDLAELHVNSFWDMRAALNRQWDIDASDWMVMGEAEKDIGDDLRVSLLQKINSVLNSKPVNPRASGMPQFNGDSAIEQEMRENGIYYALDPVMGMDADGNPILRWELLDATPWEGAPVGAYEWIAYDPQTDPYGPGYWRKNENKVLQLEKTMYEGVPQNVRPYLQEVLSAGGDIDILDDGHAAKSWVIYLLQQARMASGLGAMPQGVVFNPGEPSQLNIDRALPKLADSLLAYSGRVGAGMEFGIGARVDRGMGKNINPPMQTFGLDSLSDTGNRVVNQQNIPNPYGADHRLIEFDDGGTVLMDATGKILRYTPPPAKTEVAPQEDPEKTGTVLPSKYAAALGDGLIQGTTRPITKDDSPKLDSIQKGLAADTTVGMSPWHGNMDNVESEQTIGNTINRLYTDGSVVIIEDGEVIFFKPGTYVSPDETKVYEHMVSQQAKYDPLTGKFSGGWEGYNFTNAGNLSDYTKMEGDTPEVIAYNEYLDYLNSRRRINTIEYGRMIDPRTGEDTKTDDQGFLYSMHITPQMIVKGNIEDRAKLYLENLQAKARGATGTFGGTTPPAGTTTAPAPAPDPDPDPDPEPTGNTAVSTGVTVRGDARTKATTAATTAGAQSWTDYLLEQGVGKDKVLTGLEAASYWEKYLASKAKSTPSGTTN